MKKGIAFILTVIFICSLAGCNKPTDDGDVKYKVEIADNFPIANELNDTYSAGETVTVKLATITEQYYVLYVNGVSQNMDEEKSDLTFTYFTFTMPEMDVLIKIEERSVEIPENTGGEEQSPPEATKKMTCFYPSRTYHQNSPDLLVSEEQADAIIAIWESGEWRDDVTDSIYQFVFFYEGAKINYCYDIGIFNDVTNIRHLFLSEEKKAEVNAIVDRFIELPKVD